MRPHFRAFSTTHAGEGALDQYRNLHGTTVVVRFRHEGLLVLRRHAQMHSAPADPSAEEQ